MRDAHDDIDPWADADPPAVVELGDDAALGQPPPSQAAPSPHRTQQPREEQPLPKTPNGPSPAPKPFRTAPLTAPRTPGAPRSLLDAGPRRRAGSKSSDLPAARDPPEPYSSLPTHAAAASGSAYSPNPGPAPSPPRSPSHPLELSLASPPKPLPPSPKAKGRARSASGPSPLGIGSSPLGIGSLSPLATSPSLSASSGRLRAPALSGLGGLGGASLSDLRDVSRPGLARVTSETERAASVGSWSATNSDFGDGEEEGELVDVVLHAVGEGESLAGIALRYGIELPALRRANKLWPSDPLMRTQLLVPLDKCRATQDAWVERGEEGAVLVRRRRSKGGRGERRGSRRGSGTQSPASGRTLGAGPGVDSEPSTPRGDVPTLPDTPCSPRASTSTGMSAANEATPAETNAIDNAALDRLPLEVARVPASRLRFFPHKPNRARSSLEDRRLALGEPARRPKPTGLFAALSLADSDEEYEPRAPVRVTVRSGSYAGNPPASPTPEREPKKKKEPKRNVVRLRPPVAAPPPPPGAGLASRIQSFFSVPPPPAVPAALPPLPSGGGEARRIRSPELVEMEAASPVRPRDKKRD